MSGESQASDAERGDGAPRIDARERYDGTYRALPDSPTYWRIHREVYGAEYPAEVAPLGFTTLTDLRRFAQALALRPGQALVDVGCGQGGPGLWVARETGATLTGVDVSPVAVEQAATRIAAFGLTGRARFQVGEFAATGLPDAAFDGAMSADVLWLAPDKPAALREVARILRPGGRFAFTSWDYPVSPPGEDQPQDHRPLLHDAGFALEAYEPDEAFEGYYRALLEGYQAHRAALEAELGEARAERGIAQQRRGVARFPGWRRIFVVARLGR
jgi:ubiquinone/menaquinone biosynthesis C-methylase UbiE